LVAWLAIASLTGVAQAEPRLYRDQVEPHWFAGHSKFWYRVAVGRDRYEFILVDAARGSRQLAFDHAKVASALSKTLSREISPDQLPIDDLRFNAEPRAVLLVVEGKTWRLDLGSYAIGKPAPSGTLQPIGAVKPSGDDGADTKVVFENQSSKPLELYWIDRGGKRQRYATLQPGARREQHTYARHVWLVTEASGRQCVFQAEADPSRAVVTDQMLRDKPKRGRRIRHKGEDQATPRGPQSPDGKWVAVVKNGSLFLREKTSGTEQPLSDDAKPGDGYSDANIWWSPDSKNLVAMRVEAGQQHKIYTVESSPKDQLQPKLRTLDYLKPGDRIDHPRPQLFHVSDRSRVKISQELFPTPWSIDEVRWSADSSRFTFVYNQRGHQILRVIAVEAGTGSARSIVDEHSDTFIDYSGKYFCQWIGDKELIWMTERDGWNHLWLYDAEAGKVKNLITAGDWVVQDVLSVDEKAREVWFNAGGIVAGQDPYYTHFCRASLDGGQTKVLTEGVGNHEVTWSAGEAYFIDSWSRVDLPPVIELRSSRSGELLCKLEDADGDELLSARGGHWPERFVAKGRDGQTDIYGIILFPRDFDPQRKYPVVEQIYAGPQGFFTPKSFRPFYGTVQKLADRGMIVVQCDGMGTSGRSRAFHDVCFKNLRDAGFPDRIAWIKAAAARHPQMDLSRVGIYGGSAGGQNAMAALLWHNDFYKVAVADCGCHDNRMDKIWWNEQWMGWPVGPEYAANSNAVNAGLLQGKLLLIVGELDDNVDPASTMQVVNALEKANKDFDLVVVTGAHHGAAETPYGSRRRMEFLTRNLLGDTPIH
jgi:dipeptidyl aminopeptidase/acylaminoacyl peptidase